MRSSLLALALASLFAALPCRGQAPSAPGVTLRGTVADSVGAPVPGVAVQVTRYPQNDGRITNADAAGAFAISFPDGGATEYYVLVSGPGWKPSRARLVPDSTNPDWGRLSVRLAAAEPVVLDPVTVRAARPPAPRETSLAPPVGGGEAAVEGISAALSPAEAGDLEAMAATLPGFVATGGGFSALGLDPSQNRTTLNGLDFAGGAVPRDLQVRARVATSAYDPARGGFSGAQMMVDVAPGSAFTLGNASFSAGGAPPLPGRDAQRTGGPRADFLAGAARQGELAPERLFYNGGVQLQRRVRDAPSLATASPAALRAAGIDPASAEDLARVLAALGIPAGPQGGGSAAETDDLLLMGRIDRTPSGPRTWSLGGFARVGRAGEAAPAIRATTASGTRSRWAEAMAHAEHSAVVGPRHRNDTRTALSLSSREVRPLTVLPAGIVEVGGAEPGSTVPLVFGGAAAESGALRWSWQLVNETRWSAGAERHQLKLHAESLLEGFRRDDAGATRGTFAFRSLDDLAAGRPASYHRRTGGTRTAAAQWHGALALGDTWRVSRRFRLMGGVRVDAERFLDVPAANPAVAAAFGARTDAAPGGLAVSPRLGFSWAPRSAFPNPGLRISALGTRAEMSVGLLRGGVGVFRGRVPVEAMAGPLLGTGLSGAPELRCVGPAAPVPDWTAFGAGTLPVGCAGGGVFADAAPGVELFAADHRPPRSVRANLAWSSRVGWLGYGIEAVHSLNLDQPGVVDLNFAGVPRFTLPSEGGRPVFAAPGEIAPASGIAAPGAARLHSAFGPVLARTSELRSDSRQLTLTLAPELPGRYWLGLGYTLASHRARVRGFDGAAFGDPREKERGPGRWDARHQLHAQAGVSVGAYSAALYARAHSGLPYTPLVAGDVNGDGRWGDRAFVFDPAAAGDPALAAGMRRLLDEAPEEARRCLLGQLGRAAERGSCRGPWTQHANLRFAYQNPAMRGGSLRERTSVQVAVENPLGGIDRLLHGAAGRRGWGGAVVPDPVLYRVEGFDAATATFRYSANPDFGRVRAAEAAAAAPLRVTVQLGVRLGAPIERQQLQLYLRPGRATSGERPGAEAIQRRYARNVPDVYARTLAMADSLVLSAAQVEALRAAQAPYRARTDSVWAGLAARLAALPERYDAREAVRWQEEATDRAWDVNRGEADTLRGILTPFQLQMADWSVRDALGGIRAARPRIWRQ